MMSDAIRIYVGSDRRMGKAERALAQSIRENTTGPVELNWMRAGDPGWDGVWNRARPDCFGNKPGEKPPRGGWHTEFSCFRYAIPETAGFKGRAMYMDVDMIVLKDFREVWTLPMKKPVMCPGPDNNRWDVILFDCSMFRERIKDWPSLKTMRSSGNKGMFYIHKVRPHTGFFDPEWDCVDKVDKRSKLVHFSAMRTQPW